MADRKISDLTALTTPAAGDYLPIVDISEPSNASKNKRIDVSVLLSAIPAGTVTSAMIADGAIVNADINASAAIAGTKISPDFGSQALATTGLISANGKVSFPLGTAALPSLYPGTDTNTGIYSPGADQLAISTNAVERVEFGTSEVVFNDGGENYDFRIEGDTNANLFFVDASTDRVGLGTSSPNESLEVAGNIHVSGADRSIFNRSNNALTFGTNNAERARIDSSGRLLVGTSSSTASNGQTAPLQIAGSVRATQGLASTIDLGSIALNATAAATLPKSGLYMINVAAMNLSALFLATIVGGSVGVRLIFSTGSDVVAGLTTEPAGGTYLRLWISSGQLQVKNVNSFEGPYFITPIAT
jgi:hypothetical protein